MHLPGLEPGPPAWKADILPLDYRCFAMKTNQQSLHPLQNAGIHNFLSNTNKL